MNVIWRCIVGDLLQKIFKVHEKENVGMEAISRTKSLKKTLLMHGMKILELAINIVIFCIFFASFYGDTIVAKSDLVVCVIVIGSYAAMATMLIRIYNAFDIGMSKVSEVVYSLCLADIIAAVVFYMMISLACFTIMDPIPVILLLVVQGIWNMVWAVAANKLYFKLHAPKKTAVIYRNEKDLHKLEEIRYFDCKFNVQKRIYNPTEIYNIIREISDCEVVFVSGIDAALRNGILKYCVETGIHAYVIPHVGDIIFLGASHMKMVSVPVMRIRRREPHPEYLFVKRAFDIVASLIALVLTSPFMAMTAIAIKLYDGGPVFYKQVRLTKNGKTFKIIKFRSMRIDAEKDGVARLASENDDRITPVGKIIRAIRFDELPQLFNILSGSMTIVGPRPERPEIAAQYEETMPAFCLRLQVKAGLTGYAQVYGRYNTEPNDKLKMDLMYINNMSIIEDLKLMFATVKILFMKESTAGIEEGKVTAVDDQDVELINLETNV